MRLSLLRVSFLRARPGPQQVVIMPLRHRTVEDVLPVLEPCSNRVALCPA
jgi:hypothetical protein